MPDEKDTKLATALRQAKQTPMFFAFIAKGTSDGVLIVAKKKISAKEINDAKQESGGKKVLRGRCLGEDGKMVFELPKEPPGTLAKQLKTVINQSAGMMLQVETRVAADLEDEEEGAIPEAPPAPGVVPPPPTPNEQTAPVPPTAPPPPQDQNATRFAARLKALAPAVQRAEAAGSPQARDAKLAISEANTHFRKHEFDQANEALDRAEQLVTQAPSSSAPTPPQTPPPPTTPPPAPPGNDPAAARFAPKLKALAPVMARAEATGSPLAQQAKAQIVEGNRLYVAHQYEPAIEALTRAEAIIKQIFAAGPPAGGLSIMKLGKARIEWLGLRTKAVQDIKRLQTALEEEFKEDAEQQPQLNAALSKLETLITDLNEDLANQLDAVLNAQTPAQRTTLAGTAKTTMARFSQLVDSDPLMAELDGNEILPDMQVTGPLKAKLQEIAAALG